MRSSSRDEYSGNLDVCMDGEGTTKVEHESSEGKDVNVEGVAVKDEDISNDAARCF